MGYAEVAVNSPVAQRQAFSYSIPQGMEVVPGQAVWVPFGPRVLQGVVLELTVYPAVEETRDIVGPIEPALFLSSTQIQLARWISDYYLAPLFDAVSLMVPPGFERRPVTLIEASSPDQPVDAETLTPEEGRILHRIEEEGALSTKELEKWLGEAAARRALGHLLRRGLVVRREEMETARVRPRLVPHVRLAVEPSEALRMAEDVIARAPRQAALLRLLAGYEEPVAVADVAREAGCGPATVKALESKGMAVIEQVRMVRDPLQDHVYPRAERHVLTAGQRAVMAEIASSLRNHDAGGPRVFLLHGITGSGKTEVYLHALAEAVAQGKRGIVLVPEIALTPQTIDRFASRFPGRVAVLHSKLSLGERFDVWQQVRKGDFDVVIGPRSALFAPQPDLGLIVIDEEHEWTYKQEEQSPGYHAREVAIKLSELLGVTVVLGSATPDVESYYRAQTGGYRLVELGERLTTEGVGPLPEVDVVDMRQELKEGNRSIFSRLLHRALADTLAANQQAIIFLNRRGTATFVQCRDCGFVLKCSGCDLPLTYHAPQDKLVCHQCNRRRTVPRQCPACGSARIRFLGLGTERVEAEVSGLFPSARTLRWDRDVTRGKDSHERIFRSFAAHEADILIGTQMVAKGLDLPRISLVGIVSADIVLNLPDFRSTERTFQLISQVAGRAGRGAVPGRAVVQTYTPEHYSIACAASHDYVSFYHQEMAYRRQHRNPPYNRLVALDYLHTDYGRCLRETRRIHGQLREKVRAEGLDVEIIGPSPMFFGRIRGRFRWHVVLRGPDPTAALEGLPLPQGWTVDVDPVALL